MIEEIVPILSIIILLPLLGGVAIGFTHNIDLAKRIALLIAGLELVLTRPSRRGLV